jgi:hypothetical protein
MKKWALPAVAIVAVEYLFAFFIGLRIGFRYHIPFATYALVGASVALTGFVAFVIAKLITYASQKEARPALRLLSDLPKCLPFLVGTLLISVEIAVLNWTKIMLPIASPFWADPYLARVDHAIFRTEPWQIAQVALGWAAPLVDRAYVTWAPIKFATLIIVLFLPESRVKARVLIAYFLTVAISVVCQYLLSSAGPLFFDRLGFGDRFISLPVEPWVGTAADYLWSDYLRAGGHVGSGISAMPSLHVAIALWIALVLRSYSPRLAPLGFVFFGLILVGSVFLGWHYAADGIVAVAIAIVAWKAATLTERFSGSFGQSRAMHSAWL